MQGIVSYSWPSRESLAPTRGATTMLPAEAVPSIVVAPLVGARAQRKTLGDTQSTG
jgi:hypothetical protein